MSSIFVQSCRMFDNTGHYLRPTVILIPTPAVPSLRTPLRTPTTNKRSPTNVQFKFFSLLCEVKFLTSMIVCETPLGQTFHVGIYRKLRRRSVPPRTRQDRVRPRKRESDNETRCQAKVRGGKSAAILCVIIRTNYFLVLKCYLL